MFVLLSMVTACVDPPPVDVPGTRQAGAVGHPTHEASCQLTSCKMLQANDPANQPNSMTSAT